VHGVQHQPNKEAEKLVLHRNAKDAEGELSPHLLGKNPPIIRLLQKT